jgi:hypothetical protein
MSRQRLLVVAVVLLVALAGCSGFGGSGDGVQEPAGGNGNSAGGGDAAADASSGGQQADQRGAQLQVQQRQLIRTGDIELRVNDTEAAGESVREIAAERDGFVAASNREVNERHNETWRTERIVIRVPGESFDGAVAEVEALGEVRSSETRTEDVTDQLVDIEARLENLRAERDRLRELYEQANETDDVLAVQQELADVQEEIERLEAKKASLERDVAYSTITVHLTEEPPDPPEPDPERAWYETSAVSAFLQSISGVTRTLRAMFVAAAYVAPYVIVFGTPLAGLVALRRYRGG